MRTVERTLRRLDERTRADLLRVLTSASEVRADVVRQFHERGDEEMVEILAAFEADELLRLRVVGLLRSIDAGR